MSNVPVQDANTSSPAYRELTKAVSFNSYCIVAAFSTYFCMYAFRKPFSAGSYEDFEFVGITYKSALILSQVAGYTLSKFIGIRFISKLNRDNRVFYLLSFIGFAHFSLLMLPVVPAPYNVVCMFFNGLPLGMIWGIVFSYLEGRRSSELLGAGLSVSFIVASGVVKGIGKSLIQAGIPELWMPFCTGLVFVVPLGVATWMLSRITAPDELDVAERTERVPMTLTDRRNYIQRFSWGLLALILFHMVLTAYRDFRDNFAVEILAESNAGDNVAAMLSTSELPIAVLVLLTLGAMFVIRGHRIAVMSIHALMLLGVSLSGITTLLFTQGVISPFYWFMLTGLGLYFAYVPFHSMLFDRLVAAARLKGNAGFLIYLADSTGYLASVAVLLYKDFGSGDLSYFKFFRFASYGMSIVGAILVGASGIYLFRQLSRSSEITT